LPGDSFPAEGAILPTEVVVVAGWIIESHFDVGVPIISERPGQTKASVLLCPLPFEFQTFVASAEDERESESRIDE
jgi:hypothetical protein